jgi:hypothetical protein
MLKESVSDTLRYLMIFISQAPFSGTLLADISTQKKLERKRKTQDIEKRESLPKVIPRMICEELWELYTKHRSK